ncbi:unnamed protein product [[Candida] boidinii]|uniref:Unnamed protein product n=1 Tax=Candida boidinii TaxID=5477 RepID=A0A9W6T4F5_CANBO|nr:unnamed protein product [[Candida] boidinii]
MIYQNNFQQYSHLSNKLDRINRGLDVLLQRTNQSSTGLSPPQLPKMATPPLSAFMSPGIYPQGSHQQQQQQQQMNFSHAPSPINLNSVFSPSNNNGNNGTHTNTGNTAKVVTEQETITPQSDELFYNVTPFRDIKAVSYNFNLPFTRELGFNLEKDYNLINLPLKYDLINIGLLNYETCLKLVEISRSEYTEWASFPKNQTPKQLLDNIRKESPLLLSVCCVLGLKHCKDPIQTISKDLFGDILSITSTLISLTVNNIPQSKEFLQSIVLLTTNCLTLSYKTTYFDGWYLSSYGLIQYITKDINNLFASKNTNSNPNSTNNKVLNPDTIVDVRLWNNLSVIHLTFCILSGKPCLIDEIRIDKCREILDSSLATSMDGLTVAELSIMLSLYNSLQYEEDLETSEKDLDLTFKDWSYLCEQSNVGPFVSLVYKFAKVMIYRRFFLKNIKKTDTNDVYQNENNENNVGNNDNGINLHTWRPFSDSSTSSSSNKNNNNNNNSSGSPMVTMTPQVEQAVRGIMVEGAEYIRIMGNSNKEDLLKAGDLFIFFSFFISLTMINIARQNLLPKDFVNEKINSSIKKIIEFCDWLSFRVNDNNFFIKSYRDLISKFNETIM